MERTALVTGVSGFVGSHLVRRLLAEGWWVHGVARPESKVTLLPADEEGWVLHRHDGTTEAMVAIMAEVQPTVVFHLASLFLSEHQSKDVVALVQSNVLFGTQVVEAMARQERRLLVNTGTSWQHYENRAYSPVNLYAATKQAFEDVLQYYIEASGLRVITLKLFDTYGPNDPRPKLMNLIQRMAMENQPLAMSPGEQQIDLVHVEDVVRAFMVAAERLLAGEVAGHERYAVTSGQPVSLRELVRQVEQVLGRELPIAWGGRSYRAREVMMPWQGKRLPGWRCQTSLAEGMSQMIREYAQ